MKDEFDFDKFTSTASFSEVRLLMVAPRTLPSMRSPDGEWLYLSSIDDQVARDDAETMRILLAQIERRLPELKAAHRPDYSKISDYENDRADLEARLAYL
ncbi:hypothetical protein CR511_19920 [Pseudomonas putida]|nr:hypothetical protein CR511_19920 [Pseudomonas putida]